MANAVQANVNTEDDVVARGYVVSAQIAAVGTAATAYIPVPLGGTISRVYFVSDAAGGDADAALTLKTSANDAIAEGTIATTYVAGTAVTDASLQNTTVATGAVLKFATDGGGNSAGAARCYVMII